MARRQYPKVDMKRIQLERVQRADGSSAYLTDTGAWSDPPSLGRPPDTGYAGADAPLIEEMRHLIVTEQASTPTQAATLVRHKAIGAGTTDAIVARLRRRYLEKYGE